MCREGVEVDIEEQEIEEVEIEDSEDTEVGIREIVQTIMYMLIGIVCITVVIKYIFIK